MEQVSVHGTEYERHVKGEGIFSRTPEDLAVQDVFSRSSRKARSGTPWPDTACGTGIRAYHPDQGTSDIFYGTDGEATRQKVKKEGSQRILVKITR